MIAANTPAPAPVTLNESTIDAFTPLSFNRANWFVGEVNDEIVVYRQPWGSGDLMRVDAETDPARLAELAQHLAEQN